MSWGQSPCEEFANLQKVESLSPDDALEEAFALYSEFSDENRHSLIKGAQDGLIRAFSSHVYVEWRSDTDDSHCDMAEFQSWMSTRYLDGQGDKEIFRGLYQIPPSFWEKGHVDNADWRGKFARYCTATLSDWHLGTFGSISTRWSITNPAFRNDGEPPQVTAIGMTIYRAVQFASNDIIAVLGKRRREEKRRKTKYDWERAFAAFGGAQLKFDLVTDLYEHGAQAKIERWLADWFAPEADIPSEATLRAKASILLREFQRADTS